MVPRLVTMAMAAWLGLTSGAAAEQIRMDHRLAIRLDLAERRLAGSDHIDIASDTVPGQLVFRLRSDAGHTRVALNGRKVSFTLRDGWLWVKPAAAWRPGANRLQVTYGARFADAVPARPVNSDNPGHGVVGTIGTEGVFLLPGAGWYPLDPEAQTTVSLTVTAPAGVLAVTSGRCLGHDTRAGATISTWRVERPVEGLSLAAGRFTVRRQSLGGVVATTYFTAANDDLAPAYLEAIGQHLQAYGRLFGPYPFDEFAVVENFFPTGYGFPGFTLVGGRLLRLPFMLETSLAHEIAHSWWGNGVWVESSQGNWCEGLATYVADHRLSEMRGASEAAEYRLQLLRSYASLVTEASDLPLTAFRSREDPVTQSVGYGKAAMVFHMLRRVIGEGPFWDALRDLYAQRCFQPTSWSDLATAFERRAGRSLKPFFDGWLTRSGAARLIMTDVHFAPAHSGWRVTGHVRQQGSVHQFWLPLVLRTAAGEIHGGLAMATAAGEFVLDSPHVPLSLAADPDNEVFRHLAAEEIPVTINALKASRDLLVVLCGQRAAELSAAAALLLEGLGVARSSVRRESELHVAEMAGRDLLLVGWPQRGELLPRPPAPLSLDPHGFSVGDARYVQDGDVLFAVWPAPENPDRVTALLLPRDPLQAPEVSRKITHYGRYSYLVFRQGVNLLKGSWPPSGSPLIHRWATGDAAGRKEG
jgi:hypothetical protein